MVVQGLFHVIVNWGSQLAEIEKVRKDLTDIKIALQSLIQQIHSTHEKFGEGQVAAAYQAKYNQFQDAESLEQYVRAALNEFARLYN